MKPWTTWIIILLLVLLPVIPTWQAWGCECEDVDVNQAAAAELECLPGIGPVLSQRIVNYREANGPFESVDDLLQVSGIGPIRLAGMRDQITLEKEKGDTKK